MSVSWRAAMSSPLLDLLWGSAPASLEEQGHVTDDHRRDHAHPWLAVGPGVIELRRGMYGGSAARTLLSPSAAVTNCSSPAMSADSWPGGTRAGD